MNYWTLTNENSFVVETLDNIHNPHTGCQKIADLFLLFCLEGTAEVEVDLQKYTLVRNTQLLIMPGVSLQVERVGDDFRCLYVGCSNNLFNEMTNSLDPTFFHFLKDNPGVILNEIESDHLRNMVRLMRTVYNDKENCYRRQMARNYIQNMLFHFYSRTQHLFMRNEEKWVNRKEELFKRFVQLVHQHCTTQREVSFYARKLNITPRYLSSIVQTISGETTKDIIDRHVVTEIKIMLRNSSLNIQEISNRMKFADQSFFGRYFKKHTGMSPMQYRQQSD